MCPITGRAKIKEVLFIQAYRAPVAQWVVRPTRTRLVHGLKTGVKTHFCLL